jgi:DNA-binding SARP family transcriptional activator
VHRDLMRLHLDAGQPAAALRQYRQCEDLLRDELGVAPAPETRALLGPILGASSTPIRPTHGDVAALTTRIADLAAACDAAQAQLAHATALLRELTDTLAPEDYAPVALKRVSAARA